MTTVASSPALNDAIAQMSERAWGLLRDVHAGRRHDGRAVASSLMRDLAELARCTGVDLNDVAAYRTHSAHWRGIARLAGEWSLADDPPSAGALQTSLPQTQAG
jgi:hypothetical protein